MLSGKIKNQIYAIISASVIITIVASFILVMNFFMNINELISGVDEELIKEKTTVADMGSYNIIKDKIESKGR